MQALLDITKPVNSLSSLHHFHDSVESHIRGLTALGKSEDSYGALLVPIILGKLPTETKTNLARARTSLEWTLNELQASILTEIRVLESGLSIESIKEQDSATSLPPITAGSFHTGSSKHRTTPRTISCTYCQSTSHSSFNCDKVSDPKQRLDFVRNEKL